MRAETAYQIRVVIADDHVLYRESLVRLLRRCGIDVVGEAPDGEMAVHVAAQTVPDVILLDLRMPGVSGLQAMKRLMEHAEQPRVLVLSVSADESDVTEAMSAGASGYVLKDEPVEAVVAGIRATAAGSTHISPRVAASLLSRIRVAIEGGADLAGGGLSATELQVLGLIAAGKGEREVSERLSIGERTVGDYVRSILMKLQVETRVRDARSGG